MKHIALALAISLCSAVAAHAAPPSGPPGEGPPPHVWLEAEAARLGIDAATTSRIRDIAERERAEQAPLAEQLRAKKEQLRELLGRERPSERAVEALAREIGALDTELSVLRLTALVRIRSELTPEQNAALLEHMERRFGDRRALLERTLAACESEIAQHCAALTEGGPPHRAIGCLVHRAGDDASRECRAALDALPPFGPPGFGRPRRQ